jgi:hypothetical protein
MASLDGCTGGKAGEIVTAANLGRMVCKDITREQAAVLLKAARAARPVKPERLGMVGRDAYPEAAHAHYHGAFKSGSVEPLAEIPFVVEAWAEPDSQETDLSVCVNRTPIAGDVRLARVKRDINAFGCGLSHTIAQAPKESHFAIVVNITTPYMPITSDGKEPDLRLFLEGIATVVGKVARKAHCPKGGNRSQKSVVLDNLDAAIDLVSGERKHRFGERQVLYVVRKRVMDEIGETVKTPDFKSIITDYESKHGEIPLMFREPRGSIYHPHLDQTITLDTMMVEQYERPVWLYNKLVYIEKERFREALKDVKWPQRHDCALMSSKGFTTRAARDLVDKLAEHNEPVIIFCVHDADAYGTMIYQTFQEETRARGARKIQIINLGLEPWEALAMGLDTEPLEGDEDQKRKPVADYVLDPKYGRAPGDISWEEWLQANRIELNAMTTPQFIEWLDAKMAPYKKLIPPPNVIEAELKTSVENNIRDIIRERILREANFDARVAAALAGITMPDPTTLVNGIERLFTREPERQWRDHIEVVAAECAKTV